MPAVKVAECKTATSGVRWSDEEKKEVIRLWQQERLLIPRIAALFPGRSVSSVRHLIDRLFGRGETPTRKTFSYEIRSTGRPTEAMLADRDRRQSVPDTLGSLLCGDPKPGAGQSALERMRE